MVPSVLHVPPPDELAHDDGHERDRVVEASPPALGRLATAATRTVAVVDEAIVLDQVRRFTTSLASGKRWYAETSAADEMDGFLSRRMAALKKRSTPCAIDGWSESGYVLALGRALGKQYSRR